MHKTFIDCYHDSGFTGGGWAYFLTSNDADGQVFNLIAEANHLEEKERRLAYYVLGWGSLEVRTTAIRPHVENIRKRSERQASSYYFVMYKGPPHLRQNPAFR